MDRAGTSGTPPATTYRLQPSPIAVNERLKGLFATAYLTLVSIIQGVALATLAGQVEANFSRFDAVAWTLVSITLICYLSVWTEYVQAVMTYIWLPNLFDAAVPFAILVVEFFLAHFAVQGIAGLRGYVLVASIMFFMGVAGYTQVMIRASAPRAEADNRDLHHALDRHRWHRMIFSAASTLLALACWAVYDAAALEQYSLVVTLTIGIIVVAWVISSVPYWNRVLTYAQGIQSTQSA